MYRGDIIEESLEDLAVLKKVIIVSTEIELVTEGHQTPWLSRWTIYTVEVPDSQVQEVAELLSKALEQAHPWYADFKNDSSHYIIFKNKVFHVNRKSDAEYESVKKYGISLGIPAYQLDFKPLVK